VLFSELPKPRDLDLDLGSGRGHTVAHIRSRSTHTPNYIQIGKTFCGRTEVHTYGQTDTPNFSKSVRTSPLDDLKIRMLQQIG